MTTSMEKTLHCECGFEARAENDDGLAAETQRHAVEAQGMALSAEQALLLAVRGQLVETAWSRRVAGQTANEASGDTQLKEEL